MFSRLRALRDRRFLPCTGSSTDSTRSSSWAATSYCCLLPAFLLIVYIGVWCFGGFRGRSTGGSKDFSLTSTLIKLLVEAVPLPTASPEAVVGSFFLTHFLVVWLTVRHLISAAWCWSSCPSRARCSCRCCSCRCCSCRCPSCRCPSCRCPIWGSTKLTLNVAFFVFLPFVFGRFWSSRGWGRGGGLTGGRGLRGGLLEGGID